MAIGVGDVHVDAALTNLSVNYNPAAMGFVAEQVAPVISVIKESDKYYLWNRPAAFRVPTDLRSDGGEANETDTSLTTTTYQAEEYALKTKVTDRQRDNADNVLNLRANKMRYVQNLELISQEKRVATLLTTTANYFSSSHYATLSGTDQWDNASFTGSIEQKFDAAKEVVRKSFGIEPNFAVVPAAVAKVVKRDAAVRELIKYTQNDLLVNGDLPPTMWNLRIFIPTGINVTTEPGVATDTYADIWGKDVVIGYAPSGGALDTPALAYIVRARNFEVKSWRDEPISSEWIEVSVIEDEIMPATMAGFVYKAVIS